MKARKKTLWGVVGMVFDLVLFTFAGFSLYVLWVEGPAAFERYSLIIQ